MDQLKDKFPSIFIAGSAVILAVKYMPVAWRVVKQMYALLKGLEAVSAIPDQVSALMREVKPNGGSSLRDAIDRTAGKVDQLSVAVDELAATHQVRWRMAYGEPSWHSDDHGRCTAANNLLCDLLEYSESEFVGSNWKNLIHPEDQQHVFSEWNRIVAEGAQFSLNTRYVTRSGAVVHVRLKAVPIIVKGGVVGWIGTANKINATE